MESVDECRERDVTSKQLSQDSPKEEVVKVLNGDINGSYEEFGSSDEQTENASECHTNGEIPSSLKVPSHENGVEKVTHDLSEQDQEEPMETEEEAEETSSDQLDDAANDIEEASSAVEKSKIIEEASSVVEEASSDVKVGKEPVIEEQCAEVDSASVRPESESNRKVDNGPSETVESSTLKKISGSSSEDNEPKRELSVNIGGISVNTPYSKELEDLTKISARGSLEITIVKSKPKDSIDSKSKEHSREDEEKNKEVDVVTITGGPNKEPLDLKTHDKKREREEDDDDDSIVEITPEKSSKKKKVQPITNITPRRSSRNLNKTKSYADKDIYIEELDKKSDDDVEEIIPTDPLADDRKKLPKKTTIVVNDTKKLVEIASGSKQARGSKKEPTLVIIDTNSILSGKGAVPVSQHTSLAQMTVPPPSRTGFSMLPVGAPSNFQPKGVKPPPLVPQQSLSNQQQQSQQQQPPQPKPIILPSLTDDMYVVEAPSFIVPYVYEKPPVTSLKEYVVDMEKVIKEQEKEEKKKKKEKEALEKSAQESSKSTNDEEKEDKEQDGEKKDSGSGEASSEVKEQTEITEEKIKEELSNEGGENEEKSSNEEKVKSEDKSDTETDEEGKDSDSSSKKDSDGIEIVTEGKKKSESYFENPLGKFFMQIGVNLVQEYVQTDLLRNQKRKRDRDGKNCAPEVHMAISSLLRTLEYSKESNKHYKLEMQKCKLCNFKTESELVMAHHLETPHMRNYVYRCNFCTLEVRSPHDILFHMEAEHNVRGRLERAPAFHQCPNCPFEDNQKGKLSRHLLSCAKKYKPERNQEPPIDWEPPAKIPRVRGARSTLTGGSLYQYPPSLAPGGAVPMGRLASPSGQSILAPGGRGRPPIYINRAGIPAEGRSSPHHNKALSQMRPGNCSGDPRDMRGSLLLQYPYQETLRGMVFRPSGSNAQPQVLLPTPYQMGNSLYPKSPSAAAVAANATAKLLQQPSISITPLPRQPATPPMQQPSPQSHLAKPGRPPGSAKTTFVICEICDGYIKDLEQLRNHMQWIHKVKIHPKMIYNRPPLNCQKCQFRFFTDQGLERHLLGSHGLVTSSMQEAANKGKDGGRCPVCGRVYQWKLLNHVARDHNMSLKPAHLSYKCTVCTATFGMYKQFENHVYSAHSVVAKRVMDKKPSSSSQPSTSGTSQSDSLLKPLKINDEITIIPQPARAKTKSQSIPTKSSKM